MEPKTLDYETDRELAQVSREESREPHRRFRRMRQFGRKLAIGGALLAVIAAIFLKWLAVPVVFIFYIVVSLLSVKKNIS